MGFEKARQFSRRHACTAVTVIFILQVRKQHIVLECVLDLIETGVITLFCCGPRTLELLRLRARSLTGRNGQATECKQAYCKQTSNLPYVNCMSYACFHNVFQRQFQRRFYGQFHRQDQFMQTRSVGHAISKNNGYESLDLD